MELSPHFALEEFNIDGSMPVACESVYQEQCVRQLEPIRTQFGKEIVITSGYRNPTDNAAAHGVAHSQHEATAVYCACDFKALGMEADMRPVFDWVRQNSELPFDQIILEHNPANQQDIIHISYSRAFNRRMALEGETANQESYKSWPSVV